MVSRKLTPVRLRRFGPECRIGFAAQVSPGNGKEQWMKYDGKNPACHTYAFVGLGGGVRGQRMSMTCGPYPWVEMKVDNVDANVYWINLNRASRYKDPTKQWSRRHEVIVGLFKQVLR